MGVVPNNPQPHCDPQQPKKVKKICSNPEEIMKNNPKRLAATQITEQQPQTTSYC